MADARIHRVKVRVGGFVWVPVDTEMIESEERGGSGLDLAADVAQEALKDFPDLIFRVERESPEECSKSHSGGNNA